ncbi:MAG: NlpC/P60 family protein, partial [Thermoplasmatota archaeon]
LPHYTGALWNVGTPVSGDQLEPGDLVFFYGLGHMGIYIGGGQFVHAPHTGDVVKISLPDQKVVGHYALQPGVTALLTGGSHTGQFAKVGAEEEIRSPSPNLMAMKSGSEEFQTIKPYVFVVGKEKSEIALPEVNA